MVKSGCRGVLIGMESLDEANLRNMGKSWNVAAASYADSLKQFRKHGLAVYGTFVFGYDHDDRKVVQRQHRLCPRAQAVPGGVQSSGAVSRNAALSKAGHREGRLLKPKWWLDPESRVGDVVFRPKKVTPAELQELCLEARRQFYSWSSIGRRLFDLRANARNLPMLAVYLGLNIGSHYDIDLRQGLQLGAGVVNAEQDSDRLALMR